MPTPPASSRVMHHSVSQLAFDSLNQGGTIQLLLNKAMGKGAFGVVYDALLIINGKYFPCVAKKIIDPAANPHSPNTSESKMHARASEGISSSAESGVLRFIGVIREYLVMPKCDAILLSSMPMIQALDCDSSHLLFEHVVLDIFSGMLRGLKTISERKILHRDPKPANAGFHDGAWMMLDFDLATTEEHFVKSRSKIKGTPKYLPPEITDPEHFDLSLMPALDECSVGLMMQELLGHQLYAECEDVAKGEDRIYQLLHIKMNRLKAAKEKYENNIDAMLQSIIGLSGQEDVQDISICAVVDDKARIQLLYERLFEKFTSVRDCLEFIAKSMSYPLPLMRPNLFVLEKVGEKLKTMLSKHEGLDFVRALFYSNMIAEEEKKRKSFVYVERDDNNNNTFEGRTEIFTERFDEDASIVGPAHQIEDSASSLDEREHASNIALEVKSSSPKSPGFWRTSAQTPPDFPLSHTPVVMSGGSGS